MEVAKKLIALATTCALTISMSVPALAGTIADSSAAIQLNPDNQNTQPFTNEGMSGYVHFSAVNKSGAKEYSSTQRDSSYDGTTLIIGQQDYVVIDNVASMALEGEIENTNTTDKTMNVTVMLPRAYDAYPNTGDMHVDATRVSDPMSMVTSSNPNSKVRISFDYANNDKGISGIKTLRLNGTYAPGEKITINVPMTTPKDGYDNGVDLYLGWPSHSLKLKAIEKRTNIADLEGATIYPAVANENTGSGNYVVHEDLINAMPKFSKDLMIASHYKRVLPNASQNPDLSLTSDDFLYSNSQYLIKTEPIFNAIKDLGYSTYSDVQDQGPRGFWNAYAYMMKHDIKLVNKGDGLLIENGDKTESFYVEVHKVLDAQDLHLWVGDAWDTYDNLTYHKTIAKKLANSVDIPLDQIRVENNVDMSKAGVYDVKYLYDVAPNKTVTISAKVYVQDKNTPPVITTQDKTIMQGDNFDLMDLLVSAQDKEDGDVSDKVTITDDGDFDANTPGSYTVSFEVTDSEGERASATAVVTVLAPHTDNEEGGTTDEPEKPADPEAPASDEEPASDEVAVPDTGDASTLAISGLAGLSALSLAAAALTKRRK